MAAEPMSHRKKKDKLSIYVVICKIPPITFFFILKRKLKMILRTIKKIFNFIYCQGNANYNHDTIVTFSQGRVTKIRFTLLPETTKKLNMGGRDEEKAYIKIIKLLWGIGYVHSLDHAYGFLGIHTCQNLVNGVFYV